MVKGKYNMANNFIDISSLDFSHCLRKEYTKSILYQLVDKRRSFNLTGNPGGGRTRLIDDICQCTIPGISIIRVDFKIYVNRFSELISRIYSQMKLRGELPDRLGKLFEIEENPSSYYILLINNYDAVLDNIRLDSKYNEDFYCDLNSIKNCGKVSILFITDRPYSSKQIFIDGKPYLTSPLELDIEQLPQLKSKEISEELERQMKEYGQKRLKIASEIRKCIVSSILDHPLPYAWLSFLAKKLRDESYNMGIDKFKKKLKRWKRDFDKGNRTNINKMLVKLRQWCETKKSAAGMEEMNFPVPILGPIWKLLKKKWGM